MKATATSEAIRKRTAISCRQLCQLFEGFCIEVVLQKGPALHTQNMNCNAGGCGRKPSKNPTPNASVGNLQGLNHIHAAQGITARFHNAITFGHNIAKHGTYILSSGTFGQRNNSIRARGKWLNRIRNREPLAARHCITNGCPIRITIQGNPSILICKHLLDLISHEAYSIRLIDLQCHCMCNIIRADAINIPQSAKECNNCLQLMVWCHITTYY